MPSAKRGIYIISTTSVAYNSQSHALAQQSVQACQTIPAGTTQAENNTGWLNGFSWALGYEWHTVVNSYHHYNTPNKLTCLNASDPGGLWGGTSGMSTASSNHPAGVNVCFTDGSVRFVKDSVAAQHLVGARKPQRG